MDDEPDDFVDSGPFCIHYSDPSDCDEKCANCGHTCAEHDGGYAECRKCDCIQFVDIKE